MKASMKKGYALTLLFFITIHIHAIEFMNSINLGELGLDTAFWPSAIYAHLVNFTVQEENGFGIQLIPARALLDLQTKEFTAVTFVNAILYYDFFPKVDEIQLGPFASISTVNVLKINSVECNAGLLFSLRILGIESAKQDTVSSSWLTIRGGYKYRDGVGNFYAQIGCDLLSAAYAIAVMSI